MTIVDRVCSEAELPGRLLTFARDTLTLGWEDRSRARGRWRTDGGVEFGASLPRGTVICGGDCFVLDPERLVVVVVEKPEPMFVVTPSGPEEWALVAYQIGNRHWPLMITPRGLICPDTPGVEELLRQQHAPYSRKLCEFTPVVGLAGHRH